MSSRRCKECTVYHYWNHMGDQEKSFLNVMIGGYVAVPKKFTNNIKGQIPESIKLEVSDGKSYDIRIAKEHNELVFQSGWAKFASSYELEQCDMLVFRYSGNSRFKVQIFDQSGCEKEFSSVVMNSNPSVKGSIVNGSCGHRMSICSQNTVCKDCAAHHYWHQMDRRCFFVVLLDDNFKNGLIIPKKFAKNVGSQISERIKLKAPDGETYDIKVAKKHGELLLLSGWAVFASAYELEQGDTLVFGYSGDSRFEVQIFSPSTCEKELSCFPINSIPCVQESITSHGNHWQSPGSERMNKACTICQDCIANHYWHHMSDQDRCFIKVMMSVSNFKEKLIIPKRFADNVGVQIPEEVQLEVPNGKTYNVKVAREHNALVMESGWANFASAYDLKMGDFLVFTYSGKSHFKVRIFDPSNCEKYLSCVVMDNTCEQDRRISQDNHMRSPTSKRSAEHFNAISTYVRKTSKKSPTDTPSQKSTEDVNITEPLNSAGFQKSWLVFPMGCNMTSEQKAKVDALEQKIRPQIPLYITAMDMTSVSVGYLAISKDYVLKHLLDKTGTITVSHLDGNKTWAIALGISTVGWYALSTGCLDFIDDNRLREGDICIFQPSKSKGRVTLIFHPLEICRKKAPGLYIIERERRGESINYLSDSEDSTTPSQPVGSLHRASTSKKSGGRNPKQLLPQSPDSSNDHVKCDVIREEGSDEEHANSNYYYTRTADRLSDEEKEAIVSLASIRSNNPAFVIVLQTSHVRCKSNFLIFPSRFVADHLDSRLHEITLVRPNRKDKWCVKYCYARNGVQGIRNYTFSIFVQENRLRKGDICAFELMKGTRRVTMTVHVIRKVDGRFVLVG